MFKINVLIVTYKQADVIGRTIESILQQKEYGLNKIIIGDDCSPDNSWDVIQDYQKRYPKYIDSYRNEHNLGIYGNSNKLVTLRGNADFYCWLEGDDSLCDGFFKSAQEKLEKISLDKEKPIAIMSNFIIRYKEREDVVDSRNSIIIKNKKFFGLYMRGLISWRASLFSSEVMNRFTPAIIDQGLSLAESTFDSQFFKYLEDAYYLPITGSVYYAGIGVSVNLRDLKSSYKTTEGIIQWKYYKENLVERFDDLCWSMANMQRCKFYVKPSLLLGIKIVINYMGGYIFSYGLSLKSIKSFFGPIYKTLKDS